jgi:hypothetical protein
MDINDYELFTSNEDLKKDEDYKKIKSLLSKMIRSGAVELGQGYCISMSDMIFQALTQSGIPCKIVECKLTIEYFKQDGISDFRFIGYDDIKNPGEIDTHVVVVTKTQIPIVIDASISSSLPNRFQILVDSISSITDQNLTFANLFFKNYNVRFIYNEKPNQKLASLHHISIVDRIITDRKLFQHVEYLKKLNFVGIGLSTLAVILVILRWLT